MNRYYATANQAPQVGDKVMVFSDHISPLRFRDQTTIQEVDEWGNVRVMGVCGQLVRGWFDAFHFTPVCS